MTRDAVAGPSVSTARGLLRLLFPECERCSDTRVRVLERDLDHGAHAQATVRRLRLSERSEMVTRISRMMDVWPSLISALAICWSSVPFRRLPVAPRADQDRKTRSLCTWHPAEPCQRLYRSARSTAIGPLIRHAPGSALLARQGRAGESPWARLPTLPGRRGHDRESTLALAHALFRKGLLTEPDWGLFVWDLEGVGAALRAIEPVVPLSGITWRALPAWA